MRKSIQRRFAIFLLPTFVCFCIGFLWPFIQGIYLSLHSFTTTSDTAWAGFDNYVKAFNDAGFRQAFFYTALVAVVSLVLINVLAFFVAFALTRSIRGSNLFRGVFFVPNLIGGIVLGYIWKTIIDSVLPVSMSIQANYGFWGLIVVLCWQQVGYMMIIYIAGLQAVPEDMLEAARIDGANGPRTLWHIILPNVMPSITICTFLSLTNGFKLYDQNMVLTNGAPVRRGIGQTEMLALNIAKTFSTANQRGVAQAKAVLFFILVTALALIQLRATRRKEVQQ
ncbi:MAG: sugar ABC transporter permease [Clostridia bacterium]|nr:sugar ABC transporter permease [Clostridia bacterium]